MRWGKIAAQCRPDRQPGAPISNSQMQVGDLVFFNTMNRSFSHMGIYIGDNNVHAPRTNSAIRVDRLDNSYFSARFEGHAPCLPEHGSSLAKPFDQRWQQRPTLHRDGVSLQEAWLLRKLQQA
jgi:hypothetical protein